MQWVVFKDGMILQQSDVINICGRGQLHRQLLQVYKDETVQFFFSQKGLCNDIYNYMLPVYVENCLSRKAVYNWVNQFSQGRASIADEVRPGCPVATDASAHRVE